MELLGKAVSVENLVKKSEKRRSINEIRWACFTNTERDRDTSEERIVKRGKRGGERGESIQETKERKIYEF